jgi:hypothetical protein
MAISSLPSSGGYISLQRTITTSGWVDFGDPRLITFILAGGGGGGGGGANTTGTGGGGGGGGGGVIAGKLFIGGRIYIQIGAGGTAGLSGQTSSITRAGNGGHSYIGIPYAVSNDATATGMYWIAAGGGIGGGNGTSNASGVQAESAKTSLDSTGIPSVTGYTSPNSVTIGCSGGGGGGGASGAGNGTPTQANANYYPNVGTQLYALGLQGWANNDMRYFGGASGASAQGNYIGSMFGIDWTDFPGNIQSPTSATYTAPWTLWTTGASNNTAAHRGGDGGSTVNQPIGLNGTGGLFTGAGGGGGMENAMSGSGGGSSLNRGGESSRMFASATTYGGGGGAGILGRGADGIIRVNGTTGGAGGAGGFGGGGGGGAQCNTTGGAGSAGGQGALALFW